MQVGPGHCALAAVLALTACDSPGPGEVQPDAAAERVAGQCLGAVDGMARISGGAARVGCPAADPRCDEPPPDGTWWQALPETAIESEDFAIDLVEVSGDHLRAWADMNGTSVDPGSVEPGDVPARNIPHATAVAYCESVGKRLPRWFEWQLAAQGNLDRRYPWGDEEPTCASARHAGCGDGPAPVGGRGVTPCGVSDLAGNVAEYLAPDDRLPHLGDRAFYFFLGGSYESPAAGLRPYLYRGDEDVPHFGDATIGFRCAKDL